MTSDAPLLERARAFLVGDYDPDTRGELDALITRAEHGDAAALAELDDRFRGPLEFGTAGLRGLIGAGESRMNRAVVARATYGLVQHLVATVPDAKARGVVIGRDGRRMSLELQRDAAAIAIGLGVRVHLVEPVAPTPVTAFAVKTLGAACGIMITASHNPPAYNGYKVYWDNGAQIISPTDAGIAAAIAAAPMARDLVRADLDDARARGLLVDATPIIDRYVAAISELGVAKDARAGDVSIAYSAMHGVGEAVFRRVMAARGFTKLASVAEQAEPDGRFPTVEFPNPEEPGALDLVLALAKRVDADVVLVNDPDADRLGVAAKKAGTTDYVVLNGNEIGVLLAHHLLSRGPERSKDHLVVATIVSSQLLKRVAAGLGVRYAETLTGFKWIANEAMRLEKESGARFVFGYEEALGYTVGTTVRDKDGVSAALVMAELAAVLKAEGRTILDELESIRRRFGFLVSKQKSVTLPGKSGAERIARAMAILRSDPPKSVAGVTVESIWDLGTKTKRFADGRVEPADRWKGDVVILELADGSRVAIRPSGTEPKIKLYLEIAETLADGEAPAAPEARGLARAKALEQALVATLGLGA
ncbi:phospho-sugar mutase [Myxococcota bacterium]|nr:phospho-sugar mutase [Myxococcota bacterium]